MKYLHLIILITALTVSPFASAALIDNGDYTTDTNSGLDWLDLTLTTSLSYDYVSSQLSAGGQFDGWAYADASQLASFFDSAGGTGPYNGWSNNNINVVEPLLSLWGITNYGTNSIDSWFMMEGTTNPGFQRYGHLYTANYPNIDFMDIEITYDDYRNDRETTFTGSALVRVSAVPVPASLWLLISGVVTLLTISKRNKRS